MPDGWLPPGIHDRQLTGGNVTRVWRKIRRLLILIVGTLVFGKIAIAGYLYFAQDKVIYLKRSYDIEPKAVLVLDIRPGWKSQVLDFQTSQGRQRAVYLGREKPQKLWMMFGGNGALALDWLDVIMRVSSEESVGFLLVDYPGYGWCEGNPNPETIQENVDAALIALAGGWEMPVDELKGSLSCLGHSLGAAVALEAAARMEVHEVVVVSSFTSMQAMAEKLVGNPTAYLLRHRFDNVKSLQCLQKIEGAKVLMFHGNSDGMIPVSMSQELEKEFDDIVEYHEVEGAGHNDIFGFIGEDIARVLSGRRIKN